MSNKTRTLELDDLLDMICCLDSYDMRKPMIVDFLEKAVGKISIEDIEEYCDRAYLSESAIEEGYDEEDYDKAKETLLEFFNL